MVMGNFSLQFANVELPIYHYKGLWAVLPTQTLTLATAMLVVMYKIEYCVRPIIKINLHLLIGHQDLPTRKKLSHSTSNEA